MEEDTPPRSIPRIKNPITSQPYSPSQYKENGNDDDDDKGGKDVDKGESSSKEEDIESGSEENATLINIQPPLPPPQTLLFIEPALVPIVKR